MAPLGRHCGRGVQTALLHRKGRPNRLLPRRFGKPDQIEELGAIAERVRSPRRLRQRYDIVKAIRADVRFPAQQLPERGHGRREPHILRRGLNIRALLPAVIAVLMSLDVSSPGSL